MLYILSGLHHQPRVSVPYDPRGSSHWSDVRVNPAVCPLRSCRGVQAPRWVSSRGVHRGVPRQVPETHQCQVDETHLVYDRSCIKEKKLMNEFWLMSLFQSSQTTYGWEEFLWWSFACVLRPRVWDCGRHPAETAGQEEICDPSSSKQRYTSTLNTIALLNKTPN